MKHYEVTDKEITQEIIEKLDELKSIKNKFIEASEKFDINSCQMKEVTFHDNFGDVFCRGFSVNNQSNQRHKFKLAHGGKTLLPKKKYEQEVVEALNGLEFGLTYSMVETWNKLVKFNIDFDSKKMSFVRDGVNRYFVKNGKVFVGINATHKDANLNTKALREIKESEYLAEQGK